MGITLKGVVTSLFAMVATMMVTVLFTQTIFAATWDGEGADDNWSTAANWVGDTLPAESESITIPEGSSFTTMNNDQLATVGGFVLPLNASGSETLTVSGTFNLDGDSTVGYNRTLLLDDVTLTADVEFELEHYDAGGGSYLAGDVRFVNGAFDIGANALTLTIDNFTPLDASTLPLSYHLTLPEFGLNNSTFDGATGSSVTINGLILNFYDTAPDNLTLDTAFLLSDGVLDVTEPGQIGVSTVNLTNSKFAVTDSVGTTEKDFDQYFTFDGNHYGANFDSHFAIGQAGVETSGDFDILFSGSIALQQDLLVDLGATVPVNFTITGPLSGNGIVAADSWSADESFVINSSSNTSPVPNGDYQITNSTQTFSDDLASQEVLVSWGTTTITGTRSHVVVATGSTIKGTGTVGDLLVQSAATLAPGLSPGCLATGDLTLNGVFEVEIDGATVCTQYDQTDVTGTVDISGATLDIQRLSIYDPADATEFIIIANDGADAVTGAFIGLAEGATTTVDGVEYEVSYAGGDGNDVTLTVIGVPGAPDTGFGLVSVNYAVVALVTVLASGSILAIAHKKQTV